MSKVPTIGEMRDVVKWEMVNKASDTTGGQEEQYVDWFTGRGKMKKLSEERKLYAGYDQMVEVYDGWFAWRSAIENDLTKDVRIMYDNRFFTVQNYELVDEQRRIYRIRFKQVR